MRIHKCFLFPAVWALFLGFSGQAVPLDELFQTVGNVESDLAREEILVQIQSHPEASESLREDAARFLEFIEKWNRGGRLEFFGKQSLDEGSYPIGIEPESPLYPLDRLFQGRMQTWVTLEYSGLWNVPEARRERFAMVRSLLAEAEKAYPSNPLIGMYLGKPIPPDKEYSIPDSAPEWAIHQREALERMTDIIHWWIDNRQQESGEYGGGWGDDCEMWRWWTPILIGFEDPKVVAAQRKFSSAIMSRDNMRQGYMDFVTDVEHSAEDSSDAITPMMHLDPEDETWRGRALKLADLFENVWTGRNERGQLMFKSSYFSADKVDPDPWRAVDTVYAARAVQPTLLYWQRTRDERLGKLFTDWLSTWADASMREERGKPAGVIPAAIHWPEGYVGGLGKKWWDAENHPRDPIYQWPSSMGGMTQSLLLAFHMTRDQRFLEPLLSMAEVRELFLQSQTSREPEPGSPAWCGKNMRGIREVAAKYKILTCSPEFDSLLLRDSDPYVSFRLHGDRQRLVEALRTNALAWSLNFPGYTSEVRYTDRVIRFPSLFEAGRMFEEEVPGIPIPDPQLLYSTATGDPGSVDYFPMNRVRWLTPARDFAALVTESGEEWLSAEVFHFGESPRLMGAEFYLLAPGEYQATLRTEGQELLTIPVVQSGGRMRAEFEIPPRIPCAIQVAKRQ